MPFGGHTAAAACHPLASAEAMKLGWKAPVARCSSTSWFILLQINCRGRCSPAAF